MTQLCATREEVEKKGPRDPAATRKSLKPNTKKARAAINSLNLLCKPVRRSRIYLTTRTCLGILICRRSETRCRSTALKKKLGSWRKKLIS